MSSLRPHPAYGGLAVFALVAACGAVPPALPETAPQQPPAQSQAAAPPTADVPKTPAPSASNTAPPPAKSAPAATPAAIPKPGAKGDAKASPSAASPARAAVAPAPAPSPLDLKSLEQKLKDTKAIGLMTKLAVKNQVDDLVSQFRAFHEGRRPPTLPELRRPYELLLMKLLALLQDRDPGLAKALDDSREAIWGLLSDRGKFAQHS